MIRLVYLLFISALSGVLLGCSPKIVLTPEELSAALPAGTPYAVIHLYRPSRVAGFAIGYDVRLNDSVAYRARNGSQAAIRHTAPGPVQLLAKTEAREEFTLYVQPGREYYVRCTLGMGAVVGRPHFAQVGVTEGRKEVARLAQ